MDKNPKDTHSKNVDRKTTGDKVCPANLLLRSEMDQNAKKQKPSPITCVCSRKKISTKDKNDNITDKYRKSIRNGKSKDCTKKSNGFNTGNDKLVEIKSRKCSSPKSHTIDKQVNSTMIKLQQRSQILECAAKALSDIKKEHVKDLAQNIQPKSLNKNSLKSEYNKQCSCVKIASSTTAKKMEGTGKRSKKQICPAFQQSLKTSKIVVNNETRKRKYTISKQESPIQDNIYPESNRTVTKSCNAIKQELQMKYSLRKSFLNCLSSFINEIEDTGIVPTLQRNDTSKTKFDPKQILNPCKSRICNRQANEEQESKRATNEYSSVRMANIRGNTVSASCPIVCPRTEEESKHILPKMSSISGKNTQNNDILPSSYPCKSRICNRGANTEQTSEPLSNQGLGVSSNRQSETDKKTKHVSQLFVSDIRENKSSSDILPSLYICKSNVCNKQANIGENFYTTATSTPTLKYSSCPYVCPTSKLLADENETNVMKKPYIVNECKSMICNPKPKKICQSKICGVKSEPDYAEKIVTDRKSEIFISKPISKTDMEDKLTLTAEGLRSLDITKEVVEGEVRTALELRTKPVELVGIEPSDETEVEQLFKAEDLTGVERTGESEMKVTKSLPTELGVVQTELPGEEFVVKQKEKEFVEPGEALVRETTETPGVKPLKEAEVKPSTEPAMKTEIELEKRPDIEPLVEATRKPTVDVESRVQVTAEKLKEEIATKRDEELGFKPKEQLGPADLAVPIVQPTLKAEGKESLIKSIEEPAVPPSRGPAITTKADVKPGVEPIERIIMKPEELTVESKAVDSSSKPGVEPVVQPGIAQVGEIPSIKTGDVPEIKLSEEAPLKSRVEPSLKLEEKSIEIGEKKLELKPEELKHTEEDRTKIIDKTMKSPELDSKPKQDVKAETKTIESKLEEKEKGKEKEEVKEREKGVEKDKEQKTEDKEKDREKEKESEPKKEITKVEKKAKEDKKEKEKLREEEGEIHGGKEGGERKDTGAKKERGESEGKKLEVQKPETVTKVDADKEELKEMQTKKGEEKKEESKVALKNGTEKEMKKEKGQEKEEEKEKGKAKEEEKEKVKVKEKEEEKEKVKEKEKGKEPEEEKEKQKEKEKGKVKEEEKEKFKEKEEKEKFKEKEEKEKPKEKGKDQEKMTGQEIQKKKEEEREKSGKAKEETKETDEPRKKQKDEEKREEKAPVVEKEKGEDGKKEVPPAQLQQDSGKTDTKVETKEEIESQVPILEKGSDMQAEVKEPDLEPKSKDQVTEPRKILEKKKETQTEIEPDEAEELLEREDALGEKIYERQIEGEEGRRTKMADESIAEKGDQMGRTIDDEKGLAKSEVEAKTREPKSRDQEALPGDKTDVQKVVSADELKGKQKDEVFGVEELTSKTKCTCEKVSKCACTQVRSRKTKRNIQIQKKIQCNKGLVTELTKECDCRKLPKLSKENQTETDNIKKSFKSSSCSTVENFWDWIKFNRDPGQPSHTVPCSSECVPFNIEQRRTTGFESQSFSGVMPLPNIKESRIRCKCRSGPNFKDILNEMIEGTTMVVGDKQKGETGLFSCICGKNEEKPEFAKFLKQFLNELGYDKKTTQKCICERRVPKRKLSRQGRRQCTCLLGSSTSIKEEKKGDIGKDRCIDTCSRKKCTCVDKLKIQRQKKVIK